MTALNLNESKITHRQEIIQLLEMAIVQDWQFSYLVQIKNKVSTNPIRLVSVNTESAMFGVDREIERPDQQANDSILFRVQSGGLSVVFKSDLVEGGGVPENAKTSPACMVKLPYEVSYTQLRKSVRFPVEKLPEDIPVIINLVTGVKIDGTLLDISTTGAKFMAKQDLTAKLKNPQALDACTINLTDEFVLQVDAQLMGLTCDPENDTSIVRCQFVGIQPDDENRLDKFIDYALDQTDTSDTAITN